MDNEKQYRIRVVRGAFIDPQILDNYKPNTIEVLADKNWLSIDEIKVVLKEVKELQKNMVRHYQDNNIPWYLDGYEIKNKNKMLVGFGADDGNGGKLFLFDRNSKDAILEVINYGVSKGIPKEQMDFCKIDF